MAGDDMSPNGGLKAPRTSTPAMEDHTHKSTQQLANGTGATSEATGHVNSNVDNGESKAQSAQNANGSLLKPEADGFAKVKVKKSKTPGPVESEDSDANLSPGWYQERMGTLSLGERKKKIVKRLNNCKPSRSMVQWA